MGITRRVLAWIIQILVKHKWPIFVVWSLWLTVEYYGLGPFSYVFIHDCGDSVLPMRLGFATEFRNYGFNYWSAEAACGFDRLAAMGPLFRLDSVLFSTLPGWLTYGLIALVQRFLAGYFTYRLCKDYLHLDELPSLVAGLAYSLSFFYFQSQFAGEAGFPLLLWSLEYASEREGIARYAIAILLGIFVLFSSGFALSVPFILVMALAWFVLLRRKNSFAFLSLFATFSVVLLAGQIPTIWASLVNGPLSHRTSWAESSQSLVSALENWHHYVFDYHTLLLVWAGLGFVILGLTLSRLRERTMFSPPVLISGLAITVGFVGFLAVLAGSGGLMIWAFLGLVILAICMFRPIDRALLIIVLLLAFCMSMTALRVLFVRFFDIGFLSSFQFDRFYLLAPFFAVTALAYGLHIVRQSRVSWRSGSGARKYSLQTVLCVLTMALVVLTSLDVKYVHQSEWLGGSRHAAMYQNPEVARLAAEANTDPFRVATIAHNLHPAYANAYGLETADGYVPLYSQRYKDFWAKVIEPLTSTDDSRYHYFHDWGSRVYLFSPSDGSFDRIGEVPFSEYYNLNLLALANTRYIISDLPLADDHLTLIESPPSHVNTAAGDGAETLRDRLEGRRDLYIYENELCLPRFFVSGQVLASDDSSQLLQAMAQANLDSLWDNVFVEKDAVSTIDIQRLGCTESDITVEKYSPDCIVLSVELDKPGILVISDNYYPWWKCRVNGVEEPVFPAYHTFMGVFLGQGENTVELKYDSPYWTFR